jgi:hypothetical protein
MNSLEIKHLCWWPHMVCTVRMFPAVYMVRFHMAGVCLGAVAAVAHQIHGSLIDCITFYDEVVCFSGAGQLSARSGQVTPGAALRHSVAPERVLRQCCTMMEVTKEDLRSLTKVRRRGIEIGDMPIDLIDAGVQ